MKNDKYDNVIEDMTTSVKLLKSIFIRIAEDNKEINILHSNYHILGMLIKRGEISMSEIGEGLGISKPNLTVIIDHLIKEELVKRVYDESDRRIIRIRITEKGRETLTKLKDLVKKEFKKLLCNLSQKEIDVLSSSIKNMNELISKVNNGWKRD